MSTDYTVTITVFEKRPGLTPSQTIIKDVEIDRPLLNVLDQHVSKLEGTSFAFLAKAQDHADAGNFDDLARQAEHARIANGAFLTADRVVEKLHEALLAEGQDAA